MKKIFFFRTESGKCPIEDFLDSLTSKQAQKVTWVMQLVEEIDRVPKQYFKKLEGNDDLWEIRIGIGGNIFRLLAFFDGAKSLIVCHGFVKKTQKAPKNEIEIAQKRKKEYFKNRRKP